MSCFWLQPYTIHFPDFAESFWGLLLGPPLDGAVVFGVLTSISVVPEPSAMMLLFGGLVPLLSPTENVCTTATTVLDYSGAVSEELTSAPNLLVNPPTAHFKPTSFRLFLAGKGSAVQPSNLDDGASCRSSQHGSE